jgi:hypothetical protein
MFKRALLAAIAVLMMLPALAMAQTSSVFPASFTFTAGGPDVEFDLTLNCNGGLPLEQSTSAAADETVNFTVTGIADPSTCTFSIGGLPESGWDLDDNGECEDITPAVDGAAPECIFDIEPTDFNFWANVSFDAVGEASTVNAGGSLELECTSVWLSPGVGSVYTTKSFTGEGLYLLNGTYAPHPDGSTRCTAELVGTDSAVEVDDDACDMVEVEVGDPYPVDPDDLTDPTTDDVIICDIQATVFFEGIPTLSQYGMAIMALLMLGVGFFGFRRFV